MTHERAAEYSSAAMRLLDREPPRGYGASWTGRVARPRAEREESTVHSIVIFRVGAEWLGLSTRVFAEIAELRAIHSLPYRHASLLGLANVRGELLACVSMADTLGAQRAPVSSGRAVRPGRLVVVGGEGGRTAFPVDEVHGIERFATRQMQPVPSTIGNGPSPFTAATVSWDARTVGYLDDTLLLEAFARILA